MEIIFNISDLIIKQNIPRKMMTDLNQQINELQKNNKIYKNHIKVLTKLKDSLCKVIGTSFEVHETIVERSEELFKYKHRSKDQFKNFIKQVRILNQTILDKFKEETEHLYQIENSEFEQNDYASKDNKYSKIIKKWSNEEISELMNRWKNLDRESNNLSNLKKVKTLYDIPEELEL